MFLPLTIDAGITVALEGGLVAEYEERETAIFQGISWPKWCKIKYMERVRMVAHRRIHNLIEEHANDAVRKHSKIR